MTVIAKRLHPRRLLRTLGAASCVRERTSFVAAELRDASTMKTYTLRDSGLRVCIRHPLLDMWAFEEIFRFGVYEPPDPPARLLDSLERPIRVLDLGGNVGFFGIFARARFPGATIVSFEPDPGNARVLASCIEENRLEDAWRIVKACASPASGTVEFASSFALSRAERASDRSLAVKQADIAGHYPFLRDTPLVSSERIEVESRDVFPFFEDADLVKIDIEGGEWDLLADPRIVELAVPVVLLEYHPAYGPGGDAEDTVRRTLSRAGYEVGPSIRVNDTGLLWAWKALARSS